MSNAPAELPFGSWPSPITAASLVEAAAAVGELRVDGGDIWWSEVRPSEGGRTQLVRRTPDGTVSDVLSADGNARTRVHEYGGGAWAVHNGRVFWTDWASQRVQRLDARATSGEPEWLTPEPSEPHGWRYADLVVSPDGRWLLAVREAHGVADATEAVNAIVAIPADGSAADDPDAVVVLVLGPDFVSSPRLSPDGRRLAWTQWNHPDMPWDATELWVAGFEPEEATLVDRRLVAGGVGDVRQSIVQPDWHANGRLIAASDVSGWWNLYEFTLQDALPLAPPRAIAPIEAEIGGPQWVFGERWFTVLPDDVIVVAARIAGSDRVGVIRPGGSTVDLLDTPYSSVHQLASIGPSEWAMVAGQPEVETAPVRVRLEPTGRPDAGLDLEVLRPTPPDAPPPLAAGWSAPFEAISFPSAGGRIAHALFYPPANPDCVGPAGERPPLLVLSHGGPTSAARPEFSKARLFWTSRGFAVVDVNYGGSVGYGRPYRELLNGTWGIVDVEDCAAAARYLADRGDIDGNRVAIRGGSAGGYTTLCALTFGEGFAAGASHYGVADLAALARDTHKFESRYLDGLVGPWPEAADVYEARSPVHHTDRLGTPLIILQGLEDEIVPPAQAELMVAALAAKGVPHAYLAFEGEQHGFRQGPNIVRALEAELWFYGKVLGFTPADPIEPVANAVGLP